MEGSDELAQLMPRIQGQAQLCSSPGDTLALREYLHGATNHVAPAPLVPTNGPRRAQLALRAGTGRIPKARPFAIKLSMAEVEQERCKQQEEAAQLDPEELKDALLHQAKQQRRARLVEALRPGGRRRHVRRPFVLVLDPVALPLPEPELPASITPGEVLSQGRVAHAAVLGATQLATVATPAESLLLRGRYTPMEGVPERLLLTTRSKGLPTTVLRSGGRQPASAATPFGFSPMEGIPERLRLQLTAQRVALAGRSHMLSNEQPGEGVDSPVEGLVQQGARRSSGAQPAEAEFEFAPTVDDSGADPAADDGDDLGGEDLHAAGEAPSSSGRSPSDGGFPFLAGGFSPVRQMAEACVQTGLSLKSRDEEEEVVVVEEEAEAVPEPAAAAEEPEAEPEAEPGPMPDNYDAGGGFDDYDDDEVPEAWQEEAEPQPEPHLEPPKRRRQTLHPGARLRNELGKRKSLAERPDMGMQELVPGVRRSTRQREQPLRWWLNETKEYAREHTTLPTVREVKHVKPNTPWRTVADPMASFKRKKKKARAPTPHELDLGHQEEEEETAAAAAAAAAAEADEQQQEQQQHAGGDGEGGQQQQAAVDASDEEEQAAADPQEHNDSGEEQQMAAKRRTASRSRAAKAAPARGKGSKASHSKNAAGGKRKSRR